MHTFNSSLTGIRQRRRPVASTPKPLAAPKQSRSRHVQNLPISEIIPYKQNARTHSAPQIDMIARSIGEFGFVNPVLIDENNSIIAGHGRFEAAVKLGSVTIPTIRLEHLSPEQVHMYRIADNRIAELSEWNAEVLQLEIVDLADLQIEGALDLDLTVMGCNTPELDLIIGSVPEEDDTPLENVETPDRDQSSVNKVGDLWVLGKHRLLCENSLEMQSHKQLLIDDAVGWSSPIRPTMSPYAGMCARAMEMAIGNLPWLPEK